MLAFCTFTGKGTRVAIGLRLLHDAMRLHDRLCDGEHADRPCADCERIALALLRAHDAGVGEVLSVVDRLDAAGHLTAWTVRETLKYFDEFYETINDPRSAKRQIIQACIDRR